MTHRSPIRAVIEGAKVSHTPDDELDRECAAKPRNDLGNAERFLARFGSEFLYTKEHGYLQWTGQRWSVECAEAEVDRKAHETTRLIAREARRLKGSPDDIVVNERQGTTLSSALASWSINSGNATHLSAIPRIVAPYVTTLGSALDRDPMLLNVENGTLVFGRDGDGNGTVILREHDPKDRITKLAPVRYQPEADCPMWRKFLEEVQPDPADRLCLQVWAGYCLTGDISEQKLAFFWGTGQNGKSTYVDVQASIVGGYSSTLNIETLMADDRRRGSEASPDLAELPNVRFLRASEPDRRARYDEARIKSMTGGEPMKARHLNRPLFEFRPNFKLTISGNHKPVIKGQDTGIWRRLMLVPWKVEIPKARRDPHFKDKLLAAEASGILNWALDGLRIWLERGLQISKHVQEATEGYRQDSDPLGRFIAECTVPDPTKEVQAAVLWDVSKAWCAASGEREWTRKGLGIAMSDRGYERIKSDRHYWLGIRLIKSSLDFPDDESGRGA